MVIIKLKLQITSSQKQLLVEFLPIKSTFLLLPSRGSKENVFWKYGANLQETIHAEL